MRWALPFVWIALLVCPCGALAKGKPKPKPERVLPRLLPIPQYRHYERKGRTRRLDEFGFAPERFLKLHQKLLADGWRPVDRAHPLSDAAYEEALETYKRGVRTGALRVRTEARHRFAFSGSPRAFDLLTKSYTKAEHPEEQVQSLLVDIVTGDYGGDAWQPEYASWRRHHHRPEDAFLWCRSLITLARAKGSAAAFQAGLESKQPLLEAAAVKAAAYATDAAGRRAVLAALLSQLGTKRLPRGLLLSNATNLAVSLAPHLGEPAVRDGLRDLIRASFEDDSPEWARLVVCRCIARIAGLEQVPADATRLVQALEAKKGGGAGSRYARPRFMGVEATGKRIAYVIDLSNSMLEPLTDRERAALRRPVVTGARPETKGGAAHAPEERLDWSKIHTRFEAARAFLKLSLEELTRDQSFVIVTFGTRAEYLDGRGGMRRASRGNVARAKHKLDAIRPSSPTSQFPQGQLAGETNLHGGLRLAFAAETKGRQPSYVDTRGIEEGCDTIFLLSDGAPTEDDWPGLVPTHGGGGLEGQKPTSAPSGGAGMGMVSGPYGWASFYLVGDVWRMNMFRNAEIHCIGIGRASMGLLRQIAECGQGTARAIGKE